MATSLLKTTAFTIALATSSLFAANRPFPQSLDFNGCIKPNNVTQEDLNNSVIAHYDLYVSTHLKPYGSNQYYIEAEGNGNGGDRCLTISEAHGYGMIIFALMAGHEENAQNYFDGMFRFFKAWPSTANSYLMSWIGGNVSPTNSAADGDLDIAYALLLADKQWGSNGDINYLQEAKDMITYGIKPSDMNAYSKRIMLGDWDIDNPYSTRSSDWMTGQLHAFEEMTGDLFWGDAVDTVYSLISQITTTYSPQTGLMPDFIDGATPYPDQSAGGTGESNTHHYSYNACRYPWRIAMDYAHYGTPEAQAATSKLSGWLRNSTGGDPDQIYAGYTLAGSPIVEYNDLVFNAPFAAGTITDAANQQFLNNLWAKIEADYGNFDKEPKTEVYGRALNLLSMLLITGNWWPLSELEYVAPSKVTLGNNSILEGSQAGTFVGKVGTNGNGNPFTYSLVSGSAQFRISNDSLFTAVALTEPGTHSVTVKVEDNQGAAASNSVTVEVLEKGADLTSSLPWEIEHDRYGETVVDTGSSIVTNGTAQASFALGSTYGSNYVFSALLVKDLPGTMVQNGTITLRYKSTNSFALELRMNRITDYAYHAYLLPSTNGAWQEISITMDADNFSQPETWGAPASFDASNVGTIAFTSEFEGQSGELEIGGFTVDGLAGTTPIAHHSVKANAEAARVAIHNRALSLQIPSAGDYAIAIYSLKGQKLFALNRAFSSGQHSLPLNAIQGSQPVLITVQNGSTRIVEKAVIR